MTLLLQRGQPFYDVTANQDLWLITRCEDNFGDDPSQTTPQYIFMTYTQVNTANGQDLIQAVVDSSTNFIVQACDSTYELPAGTPAPSGGILTQSLAIQDVGGVYAYTDGSDWFVVYDASENNQGGYTCPEFGGAGAQISNPSAVRLFRGLTYAICVSDGEFQYPPAPGDDVGLNGYENGFRVQVGIEQRELTGTGLSTGSGNGETVDCPSCFVVTAALGERGAAPEVAALRRTRDWLAGHSALAGQFFALLMGEYYRFSPSVADAMRADLRLSGAIRNWLVTPLLRYRAILDAFAAAGCDSRRFAASLPEAGVFPAFDNRDLALAPRIAKAARALAQDAGDSANRTAPCLAPVPPARVDPESVFEYIGCEIAYAGGPSFCLAWAVRALALFWDGAAGKDSAELGTEIETWLAEVPLPPAILMLTAHDVARDLGVLFSFAYRSADVRARLVERLRRCGPEIGRFDIDRVIAMAEEIAAGEHGHDEPQGEI